MSKKFGSFIREKRTILGLGQRALAEKIGLSPSYLNDIEKNKRNAPKLSIIKKMSETFSFAKFLYDYSLNSFGHSLIHK